MAAEDEEDDQGDQKNEGDALHDNLEDSVLGSSDQREGTDAINESREKIGSDCPEEKHVMEVLLRLQLSPCGRDGSNAGEGKEVVGQEGESGRKSEGDIGSCHLLLQDSKACKSGNNLLLGDDSAEGGNDVFPAVISFGKAKRNEERLQELADIGKDAVFHTAGKLPGPVEIREEPKDKRHQGNDGSGTLEETLRFI